ILNFASFAKFRVGILRGKRSGTSKRAAPFKPAFGLSGDVHASIPRLRRSPMAQSHGGMTNPAPEERHKIARHVSAGVSRKMQDPRPSGATADKDGTDG